MSIAIIGMGSVGGTLGRRWAEGGHRVVFGVRNPAAPKVAGALESMPEGVEVATVAEAAAAGDPVVLATPWEAARGALEAAGDLTGKVLVDCTNPLAGLEGLALGHTTSAGEQIAGWAPGARVLKAFNTTGANVMADPDFGGPASPTMFVCGDDAVAKATVSRLAEELGFETVDAGPLTSARLLEPLAMLWIRLAYAQGMGREMAFALLRR